MTTSEWHLDKRVPVSLILGLLLQTATIIWWGARIDARVSAIESNRFTRSEGLVAESRIDNNEKQIDRLEDRTLDALNEIKATLRGIEQRLDQQNGP